MFTLTGLHHLIADLVRILTEDYALLDQSLQRLNVKQRELIVLLYFSWKIFYFFYETYFIIICHYLFSNYKA